MSQFRITRREVPHRPAWFVVEERKVFPWPRWRVMRHYVCTGADIEAVELEFASSEEAEAWLLEEVKGCRELVVKEFQHGLR